MRMNKSLAAIAALTLCLSALTACGDDSSNSTAASSAAETTTTVTTAATTTTTAVETTTTEVTTNTDENDFEFSMDDDFAEGMINEIPVPEFKPDETAARDAFNGKWECCAIADDKTAYDSILGIPVSAIFHMEITADKDVLVIYENEGMDEEEAEAAPSEAPFTFENGKLTATDTETDEDGTEKTSTLYVYLNADGQLVMTEKDSKDRIYFKQVNEFTKFDWEAYANQMVAVEDEEDGAEASEDSEAE